MKKLYALFIGMLVFNSNMMAQRYEMVWSDEFEQAKLDTDIWKAWIGTAYNNEDQFYTSRDTNVFLEDGYLHLVGLRENYGGRNWTSARIESENNFTFQYGKVEISAKLPAGKGLWPAFWMLGSNMNEVGWPYSGEIDIMEYRGHLTSQASGTVHFASTYPGTGNPNADRRLIGKDYNLPTGNFADEFRLFQFEWTDSTMTWLIDDVEFFHLSRDQIEARTNSYPFDQPFYFILNLAIGGNFLGSQQPDGSTPDYNEVVIDYIRVYQDVNKTPKISTAFENTHQAEPLMPIELQANITDEDGTVEKAKFYINNYHLKTVTEPPYQATWTPKIDGCYTFVVKAYDNDNGVGYSPKTIFEVGSGCAKKSFFDEPHKIPGTLQLEHYDYGGAGKAYYDTTPFSNLGNNKGNDFRKTEAVDLIPDDENPENHLVTETETGEWATYQIEVEKSGIYDFELSTLPGEGSARIDFKLDGEDWIYFTRIRKNDSDKYLVKRIENVALDKGTYELRLFVAIAGGAKLDYLKSTFKKSTSLTETNITKKKVIRLIQNYPNPFNPSTQISFHLPVSQEVELTVYNTLGQPVSIIHSGALNAGAHYFQFTAKGLGSGIYFYELKTEEGIFSRKMILMK